MIDLIKRFSTRRKLSCLFLGLGCSMWFGGLGYGIGLGLGFGGLGLGIILGRKYFNVKSVIDQGIIFKGIVDVDSNDALIARLRLDSDIGQDNDHQVIHIDTEYLHYSNNGLVSDQIVIMVGNIVRDQYDKLVIVPNDHELSGIYTSNHPIAWFI